MATKIQLRRGTAAAWTAANPVLSSGEPGFESNTGRAKVGDGTATWTALPYLDAVAAQALALAQSVESSQATQDTTIAAKADKTIIGYATKRGMVSLSNTHASNIFKNAEMHWRQRLVVPVNTTRWRIRLRNWDALAATAVLSGASFVPTYIGTQAVDANGEGTKDFTGDQLQALPAFTLAADGSEYVSGWVTAANLQLTAFARHLIALGYTGGSTGVGQAHSYGEMWFQVTAGISATVGSTAPASLVPYGGAPFDFRLEYEYVGANLSGLFVGDSITGSNGPGAFAPPPRRWPELYGRRARQATANMGIPSSTLANWGLSSNWIFQRANPSEIAYDYAVVLLGTNSMGLSLSSMKTQFVAVVTALRALGIGRIYACMIPPRSYAHTQLTKSVAAAATSIEVRDSIASGTSIRVGSGWSADTVTTSGAATGTGPYVVPVPALGHAHLPGEVVTTDAYEPQRQDYNDWLAGLPAGISGCFPMGRYIEARHDTAVIDPAYTTDNTHYSTQGHAITANALPLIGNLGT